MRFYNGHQLTVRHGHCRSSGASKTYKAWSGMFTRCYNKKNRSYHRYGGRGIKVCRRWRKFENFLSDMGVAPIGLWLDRKNNDGNYTKTNCRWVTPTNQQRNRADTKFIVFRGQRWKFAELVEKIGIRNYGQTWFCINNGWSLEDALLRPKRVVNGTHCYRGHKWTSKNTQWHRSYRHIGGWGRQCRECKKLYNRKQ